MEGLGGGGLVLCGDGRSSHEELRNTCIFAWEVACNGLLGCVLWGFRRRGLLLWGDARSWQGRYASEGRRGWELPTCCFYGSSKAFRSAQGA